MALTTSQRTALEDTGCDLRTGHLDRVLYATDASIYQARPEAVALPRSVEQCAAVVRAAAETGLSLTPRGAGTGLAGGAVGEGLVIDLSLHCTEIGFLDRETETVEVGPGVVLDHLNRRLAADGRMFGPDVATASRATLGGMIGNDSSGAHAPVYGTTSDHVEALQVVLSDGSVAWVGRGRSGWEPLRVRAAEAVLAHRAEIERRLPPNLVKRRPGYDFHRFLEDPSNLAALFAGSEGTLGVVIRALLRVVPKPTGRGLGIICFQSMTEALEATVELASLEPAAIEHLDRPVFGQSEGLREFAAARAFLGLDEHPCESLILVEFFDDIDDRLADMAALGLGDRTILCSNEAEQELVWDLRRSGLSLATSVVGTAKPAPAVEDACVRPEDLPAFVEGMKAIIGKDIGSSSFYGHAASGLLHIRPILDLHTSEDVGRLREVTEAMSALVLQFRGSVAGEHGVGIARTEFLPDHLGPELIELSREIKTIFDPTGCFNPGKIVDTGRWKVDRDLRQGADSTIRLPFEPRTGFIEKDRSLVGNLEQCNGCGGCRKDGPTMCPTFAAVGEEALSTRGRANVLRAALEGRLDGGVVGAELGEVLHSCLSCKACKRECPSGVDLALLKAESLQARHDLQGPSLADRLIAASDGLGRLGCAVAPLANAVLRSKWFRRVVQRVLGFDAGRTLPAYASTRFDRWFRLRAPGHGGGRGRVILWDDTWVRYHEPGVGQAAVAVLERAGFEVVLAEGRRCCGRPAISRGLLEAARDQARHNVALLQSMGDDPIVFLEPSCWSAFVDEYRQFEIDGAEAVARRCVLFEDFLEDLLEHEPDALPLSELHGGAVMHGHCHAKALGDRAAGERLVARIPGLHPTTLDTGCCGMAGAFGMMQSNQDLSRAVARPLVRFVLERPATDRVVAAGTSCRHQIRDLTGRECLHPAEVLAEALGARTTSNHGAFRVS